MLAPASKVAEKSRAQVNQPVDHIKEQELELELLALSIKSFKSAEEWVSKVITQRLSEIEEKANSIPFQEIADKPTWQNNSAWQILEEDLSLTEAESFLISLVFISQFQPSSLMPLWANEQLIYWAGGRKEKEQVSIVPTLRTVLFLLSGLNATKRAFYYDQLVSSRLFKEQIFITQLGSMDSLENQMIKLSDEYYRWLMNGKKVSIGVSADFPAVLLETNQKFEDLVHKQSVLDQLESLTDFVQSQQTLYDHDDFARKVKPGYVSMLYGPPGTGKTMTVAVLGRKLGLDVYAVDLSRVVSKYIGETEKNLEKIFDRLEGKRCILFFDEADALFGKRTEVKDARDRYANQEVAYLLQKIERFPGLVILASNYNQNLDNAFKRRILTSIFIPPPAENEREILWKKALPDNFKYETDQLPIDLANSYQLTGANISNIIKLACLKATRDKTNLLTKSTVAPFIKLEQNKEKGL
ncbi:ATP-binding protein [Fulvivirga sp. RKSG066]|uniref:ATP-binding protein n=1 Tax=Fulvivirga aurantia TaxID=2529383 RepID=UPI0012BBE7F9|nr:AAA family ATPase [Fulvivirga aurantia]MTI21819.1 ATP-binding protein [Fulvivirga aurantia]